MSENEKQFALETTGEEQAKKTVEKEKFSENENQSRLIARAISAKTQ